MIFLLLTVFLNVLLSIILKLLPRFKVSIFQAIVFNYWVCVITGSIFLGHFPITTQSMVQPWMPWAVMMGAGFIAVFNLLGYCTKTEGITAATISNKLSLVIPVLLSLYLYEEHLGWLKIGGLILAVPAVYLATKSKDEERKHAHNMLWLALLFIGSGLLDAGMKFVQHHFLPAHEVQAVFTIHLFAVAGTIGLLIMLMMRITKRLSFSWRNIVAGIILGIPNYFSIYCLVAMLHSNFLPSAASLPVNNIGILFLSSLVSILFFKEKVSRSKLIGIGLSIFVIILIAFG